ncbi:MAG TPA: TIGR02300 family protein [Myxococcales bacterium]
MARDLGTKYVCFKCGTKFYDLKKPVPACPKCGADQREAKSAKPAGRGARAATPRQVEPEEAAAAGDEEEAEAEEEDDAAESDED